MALTDTTVRYLFASEWAPAAEGAWTLKVPGAEVDGMDTAGNLLNLAIWSLREQGFIEVEQLRPVEVERVTVMGGKSFARIRPLPGEALRMRGLEGALLAKAREKPEEGLLGKWDDKLADLVSSDDDLGARSLILNLGIGGTAPWAAVAGHCFREAHAEGLVEMKGRVFKKPVIADPVGVEALRQRDAEIVAARRSYREEQEELDNAVLADCLHAVHWAHDSSPSD